MSGTGHAGYQTQELLPRRGVTTPDIATDVLATSAPAQPGLASAGAVGRI